VLWTTNTDGKGNQLTVGADANVVIRDASNTIIWEAATATAGVTNSFIAPDNYGKGIICAEVNGKWILINSTGGRDWNSIYVGRDAKLKTDPMQFGRGCTNTSYVNTKDKVAIANRQANYCMDGYNMITDPERCGKFKTQLDIPGDNSGRELKTKMDQYMKDNICSKGYDTRFPNPAVQTMVNEFCSCIAPVGDSLKLLGSGVLPVFYDEKCINGGYKSVGSLTATPPGCLCVNNMELTNLRLASDISQSCGANCTNLNPNKTTTTTTATATAATTTVTTDPTTGAKITTTVDPVAGTTTTATAVTDSKTGVTLTTTVVVDKTGKKTSTVTSTTSGSGTNTATTTGGTSGSTTQTNTGSSNTNTTTPSTDNTGLSDVTIAAIVLGCIAFLMLIIVIVASMKKKSAPPSYDMNQGFGMDQGGFGMDYGMMG
jgi:hypothetical protein